MPFSGHLSTDEFTINQLRNCLTGGGAGDVGGEVGVGRAAAATPRAGLVPSP